MKKALSVLLAVMLIFSHVTSIAAAPITVSFNGKVIQTSVEPMNVAGNIMVPFRSMGEAFGLNINWSASLQKAYAQNNEKTIIFSIGSDKLLVNTDIITLPVAPFIQNGNILVPIRALGQALGYKVEWNSAQNHVALKTNDYVGSDNIDINPFNPVIDNAPAYIFKGDHDVAKELMNLINVKRNSLNLSTLYYDEAICQVALEHSKDMAVNGYFAHVSPSNTTPFNRLDANNIYYAEAAQTLASGFSSPEAVLESWLSSQLHKDIILGSGFTHFGVGYYAGGSNGNYWTLVLVRR